MNQKKQFLIATEAERTLSEITEGWRDEVARIEHMNTVIQNRNFHFLTLRMKHEATRIEAIRTHIEPDKDYQWEYPLSFLVTNRKGDEPGVDHIVPRGERGAGILMIEVCGIALRDVVMHEIIDQESFLSLAFKVGRQYKVVTAQEEEL